MSQRNTVYLFLFVAVAVVCWCALRGYQERIINKGVAEPISYTESVEQELQGGLILSEIIDVTTTVPLGVIPESGGTIWKRSPEGTLSESNASHSIEPSMTFEQLKQITKLVDGVIGVSEVSNAQRFKSIHRLRSMDLPATEARRLLDYLADPNRDTGNMSKAATYVLVNNLLAVFHGNQTLIDDYLRVSRSVISDIAQDEVVRDYTLQGISRAFDNATIEQARLISGILWENVDQVDTSLAGTALLGLNRIRTGGALPDPEIADLIQAVVGHIESSNSGERTRISAMQVAAQMSLVDSVPAIENAFYSDDSTSAEKVSALAALSILEPPRCNQLLQVAVLSESQLLHEFAQMQIETRSK